jgi:hypothetical protein
VGQFLAAGRQLGSERVKHMPYQILSKRRERKGNLPGQKQERSGWNREIREPRENRKGLESMSEFGQRGNALERLVKKSSGLSL